MKKELIITTKVFATFEELTEERKNQEIDKWIDSMTENGLYYELYIKDDYDYMMQEIKDNHKIDFEIDYNSGSSYIYIRNIKIQPITIDTNNGYIELDFEHIQGGFNVDAYNFDIEEEEAKAIIQEWKTKTTELYKTIYKVFESYKMALLYGIDDDVNENAIADMIANETLFLIEETTVYQSEVL